MGAWGLEPFENDGAGDLLAEIRHGDFSFEETEEAFDDPSYLERDGGEIAIALGALVQVSRLERASPETGLDLSAFAASLTDERIGWIRTQIERALSGPETSEVYELWADTPDFDAWLTAARGCLPSPG